MPSAKAISRAAMPRLPRPTIAVSMLMSDLGSDPSAREMTNGAGGGPSSAGRSSISAAGSGGTRWWTPLASRNPAGSSGMLLSARDESVSLARDGKDVVGLIRALTERPPKGRDLAREIVFLDGRVRPHTIQQLVLRDQAIPMLEQDDEHVEGLRRDWYRVTVSPEPPRHRVGDERTERKCTVPRSIRALRWLPRGSSAKSSRQLLLHRSVKAASDEVNRRCFVPFMLRIATRLPSAGTNAVARGRVTSDASLQEVPARLACLAVRNITVSAFFKHFQARRYRRRRHSRVG